MHRSLVRPLAAVAALAVAGILLAGCTPAPEKVSADACGGVIQKVLLTDDSATKVAAFSTGDVPSIFGIPGTPAPTCYYSSSQDLPPSAGIVYTDTHRTLLYVGLSDADVASVIATLRKTVSVKPWTLRYDFGTPAQRGVTPSPSPAATPSSSARWYYNFAGGAEADKGEMGYYATTPISQGTAIQAGLSKPSNVLRIELDLKQVKK